MLTLCTSLVVAGRRNDVLELADFSRQVGFGTVINPDQPDSPAKGPGPITFFLIHTRTPVDRIRSVIRALRRASDINLRFAPVIALGPPLTELQMRQFAAEGFDDIIGLPMDYASAAARLEHQLLRTHTYFETADYLGPDRRRYSAREQTVLGSYVLYHVHRDIKHGTSTRAARIAGKPQIAPAPPKLRA